MYCCDMNEYVIPLGEVERTLFLTMEQAAALTGVPTSALRTQVELAQVPVLWGQKATDVQPEPFVSVPVAQELARRMDVANARNVESRVVEIRAALQDYLVARPPVREYDVAVSTGTPYVARMGNRHGMDVAHIQVSAFQVFQRERGAPLADRIGETVESALDFLGARVMRGLRDDRGTPRGRVWWRLPATMWRAGGVSE
jgi:hypothetical protein